MNNTLNEAVRTPRFNSNHSVSPKDQKKSAGNNAIDTTLQLASSGFNSSQITTVLDKAKGNLLQRPWEDASDWAPFIESSNKPGIELKPITNLKPAIDFNPIIGPSKPITDLIDIIKPGFTIPTKPFPGFPFPGKPIPKPEVELADPGLTTAHNTANADRFQGNNVTYQDVDGEIVVDGVQLTDIDQGQVANCYLMAALGSIALHNPEYIENMITDNGNGTYTVSFGGEWGDVIVDDDFAVFNDGSSAYADFGDNSNPELWVAIIEKAYVQANRNTENGNVRDGTYQGIGWGNSSTVIENITGQPSSSSIPPAHTPESLKAALDNDQSVILSSLSGDGTKKAHTPDGLWRSHAYVLSDVRQNDNGEWVVVVYNPHGPVEGGFTELTMEQFNANFRAVEMTNGPIG